MTEASAKGADRLFCANRFQARNCDRNRTPQKSQRWQRNRKRISHCPVSEVKLLRITKSNGNKSGKLQLMCQRAPPNGTQKPGRIRSYGRSGAWGHGESGEAASI